MPAWGGRRDLLARPNESQIWAPGPVAAWVAPAETLKIINETIQGAGRPATAVRHHARR